MMQRQEKSVLHSVKSSEQKARDNLFDQPLNPQPFVFNKDVAAVFDDMALRSIPIYHQANDLSYQLIKKIIPEPKKIIDLGCSTATSLLYLIELFGEDAKKIEWVGVDNSQAMIEQARAKILGMDFLAPVKLFEQDVSSYNVAGADVVLLNYILQFLKIDDRKVFLKKLYQDMAPHSILFVSEKIKFDSSVNDFITAIYEDFKFEKGYSRLAIAQKRKALDNVLIPLSIQENLDLFKSSGFLNCSTVLQWGNFVSFVAIKET